MTPCLWTETHKRNKGRAGRSWSGGSSRLGNNDNLLDLKCTDSPDIALCVKHKGVLSQFFVRMASVEERPLPGIDDLKEQICVCAMASTSLEEMSHGRSNSFLASSR